LGGGGGGGGCGGKSCTTFTSKAMASRVERKIAIPNSALP